MTAARILSEKGADVFSINPHQTLVDAARALAKFKVGVVVVMGPDKAPVGVFSERDLARAVAEGGPGALDQAVRTVMSTRLVTAPPSASVDTLMAMMTERRVRHVLIMQAAQLCGLVSIGDVVKRKIAFAEAEAQSLKSYIEGA